MTDRAELVTWCRILATGPACPKPCDDCRRTSAINAKLPDGIRVTLAAAKADREAAPDNDTNGT